MVMSYGRIWPSRGRDEHVCRRKHAPGGHVNPEGSKRVDGGRPELWARASGRTHHHGGYSNMHT
jgi:hypothetical protein